jgi:dipeptidyl aminopeptidase/acylaminoacyl peptidase
VFRATDWSPVRTLTEAGRVSKLLFSSDGRWLVAAGEGTATVFETKRWEARKEIPPPETESRGAPLVGFSPDGKLLVAASYGLVRLFGGDPWREIRALRQDNAVKKMAFSPDGQWLAVFVKGDNHGEHVIKPNEVHIWNTSDWTSAACKDDEPRPADDTQQSRYSVCADVKGAEREVALSEVLRWKETPGPDPLKDTRGPGGEDYVSPDGLWSVVNRGLALQLFYAEGGGRPVATLMRGALTFTPDSRWLLVYEGGNVGLWPLERARMIDAACARLHRRDLTEEERRQYISDGGTEATCAPAR